MRNIVYLSGEMVGNCAYIKEASKDGKYRTAFFKCRCGKEFIARISSIKYGNTKSCGCIIGKQIIHGHTVDDFRPEYDCWSGIKKRCYNPKEKIYKYYGGRGIKMCDRWLNSPNNFISDMGKKPSPKHSIERIDVDGNYEPSNCRWATQKEQVSNKRNNRHISFNGESHLLSEWADKIGITHAALIRRLKKYPLDKSLLTPKQTLNGRPL